MTVPSAGLSLTEMVGQMIAGVRSSGKVFGVTIRAGGAVLRADAFEGWGATVGYCQVKSR